LLSGGPNAGRQDDAVKKLPQALPPAKDYVDDQASYASNEIAINWQAPLVFLLAGTRFLELNEVSRRHAEQKGGGGRVRQLQPR
jgi:Glycosyl hydrolase family 9